MASSKIEKRYDEILDKSEYSDDGCRAILIAEQLDRIATLLEVQNELARVNLRILKANAKFLSD